MNRHAGRIVSRIAGFKALLAVAMIAGMLSTAGAQLTAGSSDGNAFEPYELRFPVDGEHTYTDTFGAPRSGGRTHKGTDIFAVKGTPVVAAADGTVMRMTVGKTAGRYIVIEHLDGWRSYYLHLDNDTPGTDDGSGGASAPGIEVGTQVAAGDVLDYVGDSGNAEETPSHLHFELHQPDNSAVNPTPHLRAAQSAAGSRPQSAGIEWSTPARPPSYLASGTEMVGHFDPGGGFAAGLAVHGDIAYMGTWGRPTVCPASGVRLIDVEDPAQPTLLATVADAAEFPSSSTDSVWVGSVETEAFSGDLAVVAVRLCDTSERNRWRDEFRGLAIYDVTNPGRPELLSAVHTGERTQGANEVTAAMRPDGSLVIAATVMQSLLHTEGLLGDFRLIDATDPRHPVPISDWDVRRDLPPQSDETVEPTDLHVHSVWLAGDGMTAWLAAWDAGIVLLDLAAVETPVVVAHVPGVEGSEGNAHTVAFDPESGLLIRSDEDLDPFAGESVPAGWGGQTLYDATDPDHVRPIATYLSSDGNEFTEELDYSGYFSAHEVQIVDGVGYASWYSDGLRVIDLSDPSQPTEVAFFIPPAAPDPQLHWVAPDRNGGFPLVWGVTAVDGLVFLSDVNTGLWIVRYVPPSPEPRPSAGDAI